MAQEEKQISILEFSRRVGCDESTTREYIRLGKLHGEALGKSASGKTKIIHSKAVPQFEASRANTQHLFARSGAAALGVNNRAEKLPPASPDVIPAERRPQYHGGNLKSGADRVNADISGTSKMSEEELGELDIAQLTKKEAVLRVVSKQLEVDEKTGQLVRVEVVYNALFTAGQELRNRVEAVPVRVIDDILAAPNRAEALLVLSREIKAALTQVTELGGLDLTKRKGASAN